MYPSLDHKSSPDHQSSPRWELSDASEASASVVSSIQSKWEMFRRFLTSCLTFVWSGFNHKSPSSSPFLSMSAEHSDKIPSKKKQDDEFMRNANELICRVSMNGKLEMMSPLFCKEFSIDSGKTNEFSFLELFNNDETDFNIYMKKGKLKGTIETSFTDAEFNEKWYSWTVLSPRNFDSVYLIGKETTIERNSNRELKLHSEKLEEIVHDKTDCLNYARILQQAIFHDPETLTKMFPESFIFHSSKDIVSGDFYWFDERDGIYYTACADCTGHGVPGALLSVLGIGKLHDLIQRGKIAPSEVLNQLNAYFYEALGKKYGSKTVNDGMDISFFSIDKKTNVLEFAGARNPLVIVRGGSVNILEADKMSIGGINGKKSFTSKTFQLQSGDMIYSFTDGYADQFGGEKSGSHKFGKKFSRKRFKLLLQLTSSFPIEKQKEMLEQNLLEWSKDFEQTDDICVIGIRIS